MDGESAGSKPGVAGRLEAARLEFDAQAQRFEEARSRLQETADAFQAAHPRRGVSYYSAYARLQARLDALPIIEQAKGILMARHQCGPEEAFDLLHLASRRAKVKVQVLAERIVAGLASHEPDLASEEPDLAAPTG